ncbi:carboxyltransferase domain-containing protein, partial [Streptomyces sp. SID5789]|uniref:carboxyltransferase domain-containing protein n=2 Tax=unclassified Streptomyces TaxID=2593676 RepID=UPI001F1EE7E2
AVPAGSVALAGPYTGVYPRSSPGGWQLIGTTDAVLWDHTRVPAALLSPGTRVRFVPEGPGAPRAPQALREPQAPETPQTPPDSEGPRQTHDRQAGS